MAPVIVGDGRVVVVARFVGGVVVMSNRSCIRIDGGCLYAGETGHAAELLSRGWLRGFELPVDVIRSGGGERERQIVRVGPRQRCAYVLFPEFTKFAELCLPRGHPSTSDSPGGRRELIRNVNLAKIHEYVLVDVLSVMVGEERGTVRGDAGDDVGVVKAHETKSRRETFMIIRFAGVPVGRWIIGCTLGDGGRIVERMVGRVTELGSRNGSRVTVINGVVVVEPQVVRV